MSDSFAHDRAVRLTRREMVRIGAVGAAGLTLPEMLWSLERSRHPASAKSCIFIILSGGPGQHETFDPKPLAPREIRGQYDAIPTATPGVFLGEKLPRLATLTRKYCLVRSMSHADPVHVSAAHTMLTGQSDGSRENDSPTIGSLVSKLAPAEALLPSHVWLHNMKTGTNKVPRYESGLSAVGYQHAPLRIGYELDNPSSPDFRVGHFDPPDGLTPSSVGHRFELLRSLELIRQGPDGLDQYGKFRERASQLVTGREARDAFALEGEPTSLRDRYGRHPLGQYLLMARRLVEAGVRLVSVAGWPGLAPGETTPTVTQVWDTHDSYYDEGDNMYGNGPYGMQWALPRLDEAVSALLIDLDERGLLQETLVVVVGEFGRTPKFEGEGRGRGHWPHCYTSLLAGGGVRGGQVYGESDSQAAYVSAGRPISHADFGATMLQALGIPPETRYGPDGFSLRASEGHPLTEIFG